MKALYDKNILFSNLYSARYAALVRFLQSERQRVTYRDLKLYFTPVEPEVDAAFHEVQYCIERKSSYLFDVMDEYSQN